jgi:hypothetical protein
MNEIEVRAAIDRVFNAYALGMDMRDTDRFLTAFHPDGTWLIGSAVGTGELNGSGHEAIAASLDRLWSLEQLVMHATTNHDVVIQDDSHATGQSHAVVMGVTHEGRFFIDAVVYPEDRFECRDGVWRLAHRRVDVGAHVEFDPATVPVELYPGAAGVFVPES